MRNQRGIIAQIYLYAAAILAVTIALGALYWKVHHDGYEQGKAETLNEWAAANEKAEAAAESLRQARQAEAAKAAASLASASNQARDFESRWRAARNTKPVLATVGGCNVASVPSTGTSDSNGISLRLSADFLRLYDTAWTNSEGKPVFADTGIPASPSDATVTLDALIDTHAENASRCSQTSRQLNALIDLLTTLRNPR